MSLVCTHQGICGLCHTAYGYNRKKIEALENQNKILRVGLEKIAIGGLESDQLVAREALDQASKGVKQ